MVVNPDQTTGPIAAFLQPLPPSQSEEEAKAQAASLCSSCCPATGHYSACCHPSLSDARGHNGRGQGTASSREALPLRSGPRAAAAVSFQPCLAPLHICSSSAHLNLPSCSPTLGTSSVAAVLRLHLPCFLCTTLCSSSSSGSNLRR